MSCRPLTPRQRHGDELGRLRLRAFQKRRKLTNEGFAEWLGIHVATLNNWLVRGRRVPGWPLELVMQAERNG
jgi:DNA-binding transcriptional regulator YiaG